MELTELFGGEALTYDQFAQRCAEHKAKFADLSGGAYVGKEKYDTLAAERDGLKRAFPRPTPSWRATTRSGRKRPRRRRPTQTPKLRGCGLTPRFRPRCVTRR